MKTNPIEKINEHNSENRILLETIIKEGDSIKSNFWDESDLKKIKSFTELKNKPDHEKIDFIFYTVDQMIRLKDRQRSQPEISSKSSDFTVFIYLSNILNALLRSKIEFKELQIQQLFLTMYENRKIVDFNRWPIIYIITQIERMTKRDTLSEGFLQFLTHTSSLQIFNSNKSYVGNDIEKAMQKLKTIVFKLTNKNRNTL